VVGNFDEEVLPKDKTMVLARLVASLLVLYPHLTVDDIHYHREVANKTCPGLDFPSLDFIRRVVGEMV
jgi:hypothetical protein